MAELTQPVRSLRGVGEKRAQQLKKLGVVTVGDLLRLYPRSYEDFSSPVPILSAVPDTVCCVRAFVTTPIKESMIRRGMTIYRFTAQDESGAMLVTFFNNRYIGNLIHENEEYLFLGKLTQSFNGRQMASPQFMPVGRSPGLMPVYPLTEGLSNRMVRELVRLILSQLPDELDDPLPSGLRKQYNLCHLRFARRSIHFPQSQEEYLTARRRLVFEELLTLLLGIGLIKEGARRKAAAVCKQPADFSQFEKLLPFALTGAQKRAIGEAAADMAGETCMNRLLQGDVGSGKTAVAAALCWHAANCGFQSALMAPTEVLARQHLHTLRPLLAACGITCELLTGGMTAAQKAEVRSTLQSGETKVAVGTHALLEKEVHFQSLGLVITDEQHRFGVRQRALLSEKGQSPHMLVMSATPIPRTLALIIYDDLDISVLDELPVGRLPVKTYLIDSAKRRRAFGFVRGLLDEGRQAFLVCPLVEEGESGLKAAVQYCEELTQGPFAGYPVGLLHGRMRPAQKQQVMADFVRGAYRLLVSTTVIEVGVDVPSAAVMVVENAERFGFSQLHQLRGRVGRSREQSYCILISDTQNRETLDRLRFMCKTNDGFKIAQKDLEQRGPGDFFGSRQHGLPELKIADLFMDMDLLQKARAAAGALLRGDPGLRLPEHTALRAAAEQMLSGSQGDGVVFN